MCGRTRLDLCAQIVDTKIDLPFSIVGKGLYDHLIRKETSTLTSYNIYLNFRSDLNDNLCDLQLPFESDNYWFDQTATIVCGVGRAHNIVCIPWHGETLNTYDLNTNNRYESIGQQMVWNLGQSEELGLGPNY